MVTTGVDLCVATASVKAVDRGWWGILGLPPLPTTPATTVNFPQFYRVARAATLRRTRLVSCLSTQNQSVEESGRRRTVTTQTDFAGHSAQQSQHLQAWLAILFFHFVLLANGLHPHTSHQKNSAGTVQEVAIGLPYALMPAPYIRITCALSSA